MFVDLKPLFKVYSRLIHKHKRQLGKILTKEAVSVASLSSNESFLLQASAYAYYKMYIFTTSPTPV